ncbi:MAG: hypothetical protein ACRDJW_19985 [Thermomicrobiales bacterium]
MRRAATIGLWWALVMLLLLGGSPAVAFAQEVATPEAPGAQEEDAGDAIDRWRVQARLSPSLFGPEAGTIDHDPERVGLRPADVSTKNFYARATFLNPYDAAEQPFDYGFSFRRGRDAAFNLYLISGEGWVFDYGGTTLDAGPVDGLETGAGATNELEVAVVGGEAHFALNGDQIATVDVSRRDVSGDVAVGTAFTNEGTQEGATTPFEAFQVWSLDGAVEEDSVAPDPAGSALLDAGRAVAQQEQATYGPLSGNLTETGLGESVQLESAGVDVADFYLRLRVTAPRDVTEQPWDVGIGFRDAGENNQYRLTIASDGTWYYSVGVEAARRAGTFAGLETAAGAVNLIELVVEGTSAGLAVNGSHVATFVLEGGPASGNVWIAAGLYLIDAVSGATTAFEDFTIWSLGAVQPETPEAEESPEAELTEGDEATFRQFLDASRARASIAGPDAGEIPHDAERVIIRELDVDVQDFVAHVSFTNPYPTDEGSWDYGIEFRLTDEAHYRLYVTSNGEWFLALGSQEILDQGEVTNLDTTEGGTNELDVVVAGDVASFAVNGEFVVAVDVSGHAVSGSVAAGTAFLEGNFVDGAVTPYEEFEVWALVEGEAGPVETEAAPTEVVETPEASPVAGEPTYTSPAYGFSVRWDETWTEVARSGENEVDTVRIDNGVSTVDFYGYSTTQTPGQCVDAEFTLFETTEGYSDARVMVDENGQELRVEEDGRAWGVFEFVFTTEGGALTDYTAYVECRPIVAGESMVLVVQYVTSDQFADQEDAREELLATLQTGAEAPVEETATVEPTEEATEEPTEEATAETTGSTVNVRIGPVGDSGVNGLATLVAVGDQTEVTVLAIGAEAGAVVLIQEGGCDSLTPAPAHLLRGFDATGTSTTTVNAPLADLQGGFSITIHADVSDLSRPVACGEIL